MCLADEIEQVLLAGVNSIYIDFLSCRKATGMIMGPKVCRSLREYGVRCPVNVLIKSGVSDLMIHSLCEAGADQVILDTSAIKRIAQQDLEKKSFGCSLGLSITQSTLIEQYGCYLPYLDSVLVQLDSHDPESTFIDKIRAVKTQLSNANKDAKLALSGSFENYDIAKIAEAGVDIFVFGKSIFSSGDYYTEIAKHKKQISSGCNLQF